MKKAILLLILIFCIVSAGCSGIARTGKEALGIQTPTSDNGSALNESVRPGDDFYSYVNDAWIAEHPVPADKKSYTTFAALKDTVDDDLHTLLQKAVNTSSERADQNITLLGQFYRSGMDNGTIDREGLHPLTDPLTQIDSIDSRTDLTGVTVMLLRDGSGPLYDYHAEVNPRNSTEMIACLEQGGIGLPDRDYYMRGDNKSRQIQDAYQRHIERVFHLAGEPDDRAARDTETVYNMEKTLAGAQFSSVENQDPNNTTNLYPLSALEAQYPAIGWEALSTIPGSGPVNQVNLHQPRYVNELNTLMETAPLEDWKVYLRYQVINKAAPYLSTPFEEEDFAFYSTTLNGVQEGEPQWKRVVHTESDLLGDLVGREYVAEYVDPRTRAMVSEMLHTIRQTFDERISNLSWMDDSTKEAAHTKLAAMGEKIAYPDRWTDYSGLNLSESYIGNVRAVSAYTLIHGPSGLENIGRPIDTTVWFMSPQTVNAYYDPTRNEMVFPAAILQPPFFDPDADPESNYGALGWVLGHEMTHGFDSIGRQFDKNGTLNDWWTEEDARTFDNRTHLLVTEYSGFDVFPGLSVDGNLTLSENIADFGGLTLAYHAWKDAQHLSSGTAVSNRTADRRFFIAAAGIWRGSFREEYLRNQVYTDPHSPSRYRVDGSMFNIPEFYEAFPEIQPGDALYRNVSQRAIIW